MIVLVDGAGRFVGHMAEGYPAPAEALANIRAGAARDGRSAIDVPPLGEHWYFPNGEPKIRPRLAIEASSQSVRPGDSVTISGIPAGTTVYVSGPHNASLEADGEPIVITFTQPGEYTVGCEAWPHLPENLSIRVEE